MVDLFPFTNRHFDYGHFSLHLLFKDLVVKWQFA